MTTAVEAQYRERARSRASDNESLLLFLNRAIAAIDPDDLSRQETRLYTLLA